MLGLRAGAERGAAGWGGVLAGCGCKENASVMKRASLLSLRWRCIHPCMHADVVNADAVHSPPTPNHLIRFQHSPNQPTNQLQIRRLRLQLQQAYESVIFSSPAHSVVRAILGGFTMKKCDPSARRLIGGN